MFESWASEIRKTMRGAERATGARQVDADVHSNVAQVCVYPHAREAVPGHKGAQFRRVVHGDSSVSQFHVHDSNFVYRVDTTVGSCAYYTQYSQS